MFDIVMEAECLDGNCICAFKDEDYVGFTFDEAKHRFVAVCDECGELTQPVGYQGVLECSMHPFEHPKFILFSEDYPPFFDSTDEE